MSTVRSAFDDLELRVRDLEIRMDRMLGIVVESGSVVLRAIAPSTVPAGGAIQVKGNGFTVQSVVFGGQDALPTVYESAKVLTATVPTTATVGATVQIAVQTAGAMSNTLSVTIR